MKNKKIISIISNISKATTVLSMVGLVITLVGTNLTSYQSDNIKVAKAADLSFQNGLVKIDKKFYTAASPTNDDAGLDTISTSTGSTVTVRLKYENTGDFSAENAQIIDSLPSGFSIVSNSFKNCLVPSTDSTDQYCTPSFTPGSNVLNGQNITISPSAGLYDQATAVTPGGTTYNSDKGVLEIAKKRYLHTWRCNNGDAKLNFVIPGQEPFTNSVTPAVNYSQFCAASIQSTFNSFPLLNNRYMRQYLCPDETVGRKWTFAQTDTLSNAINYTATALAAINSSQSCLATTAPAINTYNMLGNRFLHYYTICPTGLFAPNSYVIPSQQSFDNLSEFTAATLTYLNGPTVFNCPNSTQPLNYDMKDAAGSTRSRGFIEYKMTAPSTSGTFSTEAMLKTDAAQNAMANDPATGNVITVTSTAVTPISSSLSSLSSSSSLASNNSTTIMNSNRLTGSIGSNLISNIPLGLNSSYEGKLAEFYFPGSTVPVFGKIMNGGFVPNNLVRIPNGALIGDQNATVLIGTEQFTLPTSFTASTNTNSSSSSAISSITSCVSGYLPSAGSAFCSDCPAGSYCQGTTKIDCPSGLTSLPKSTSSSDCKTSVNSDANINSNGSKFAIKDPYLCGGEITGNVSGFVASTDKVVVKVTKVSTSEAFVSDAPVDANGDYRVSTSSIASDDYYVDYYLLRNGQEVVRGNRYLASIRKPEECNKLTGPATTLVGTNNNTNSGGVSGGLARTGGSNNLILGFVVMTLVSATASYLTNSYKNSRVSANWKKI
jgi:uncharacterized repeat protein (TIGR01451 family)